MDQEAAHNKRSFGTIVNGCEARCKPRHALSKPACPTIIKDWFWAWASSRRRFVAGCCVMMHRRSVKRWLLAAVALYVAWQTWRTWTKTQPPYYLEKAALAAQAGDREH